MTKSQQRKLNGITPVLNHWESVCGELIVETTYGTKYYQQIWIGPKGGFALRKVYKGYDTGDKKPFHLLFVE